MGILKPAKNFGDNGSTVTVEDITDASDIGRTLLQADSDESAQQALGLGSAAGKTVGTDKGNVMEVGAFGLGTGPQHRDDAFNADNIAQFYRVNATSKNKPPISGNIAAAILSMPCDGAPSAGYLAIAGNGNTWFGYSTTPDKGITWFAIGGGMVWRGEYIDTRSYQANNIVGYNGSSYICIAGNVGVTPEGQPDSLKCWSLLASGGTSSLNWRGTFFSSETYSPGDVVLYSGAQYICLVESTGIFPTDDWTHWDIFIPKPLNWRGEFINGYDYYPQDAVSYNGSSYFCTNQPNGIPPEGNPRSDGFWGLLAQRGDPGSAYELPAATPTTLGGMKMGEAVELATQDNVVDVVNALVASLVGAGIINNKD